MYHFFVKPEQVTEHEVAIIGSDVNHIKNVLRMRIGEEICVNDGSHEYLCSVAQLEAESVVAKIEQINEKTSELPAKIVLFQGLPKADKMETIIQKCVELGIYEIVPVQMKRCVVKLDSKKEEAKRKRWQAISESAAKQAGRGLIPQMHPLMTYKDALAYASGMEHILVPFEHAKNMQATRDALTAVKKGEQVAIFIGPEGGFEDEEVAQAEKIGAKAITLGRRILRTETAGMAVLAMLGYVLEE